MTDSKINVSNSCFGTGFGLFLFLSVWLVVGRGWENEPSVFEHWLKARYQYQAMDADWQKRGGQPAVEIDLPIPAPAAEVDEESALAPLAPELIDEPAGSDSRPPTEESVPQSSGSDALP